MNNAFCPMDILKRPPSVLDSDEERRFIAQGRKREKQDSATIMQT